MRDESWSVPGEGTRTAELDASRAEDILESVGEAFYAVDADFRFTYVNQRAESLWGRRREDLLGKHYWTEFPQAVGSESYRMHLQVMDDRRPVAFETVSPILDRWIEASIFPERRGGLSCYFRDITSRKEAEAALTKSETRLAALIDAARDFAIVGIDEKGIVTDVSEGAERILGWKESELMERHIGEIYTEEDRAAGVPEIELQRCRDHGRSLNERWHVRKNGAQFWGSGYGYPLAGGGFVKVFQDRTAEVRAEAELERKVAERTAELSAANAEMETFNYSVSHDLRAPLRAISMTSAILLEEARDDLPREHRELLERQGQAANRLAKLIDELLRMSRLGRQPMVRQEVDVSGIARAAAEDLKEAFDRNGVTINIASGLRAFADPTLLRLVLQNLLENACKFSPQGGMVSVGETETGGEKAYYVRDQGIGFETKYAQKLFLPFERLVSELEFPGTGIGLANVQRIVQRHGGRVWAESEGPGSGATFYFTLAP